MEILARAGDAGLLQSDMNRWVGVLPSKTSCHTPAVLRIFLLIKMQHYGKTIEHGPDRIIFSEIKAAAAFVGHQGT